MRWLVCATVLLTGTALVAQESKKTPNKVQKSDMERLLEELEWLKRAWEESKKEREEESADTTDAFGRILAKMKAVERYLAQEDVGKGTQRKEAEIIRMLTELIEKPPVGFKIPSPSDGDNNEHSTPHTNKKIPNPSAPSSPRLLDPNRLTNARPGAQRIKKFLKKEALPKERVSIRPSAARSGWTPRLSGRLDEDGDADAAEKFPLKFQKIIRRYYENVMKGNYNERR